MHRGMKIVMGLMIAAAPIAYGFPIVAMERDGSSTGGTPRISLKEVTSGLSEPVAAKTAGDGTKKLFVVEQDGSIRIVKKGRLKARPFLDITHLTDGEGEQGLLGLAFHPRYKGNRRFFVHYTAANGDTVISEFKRKHSRGERANPNSERILLQVDDPYSNHNGGDLAFGPDGYLYIALGDGGGGGDPDENGQDLSALLGKILRIDVDGRDGDLPYAVPDDNPFVGQEGARDAVWSYGLRNPWRFSFDSVTGDMWVADVGQDNFEEINVERAGSGGGVNYGWDIMEADRCFEPADGCDPTGITLPVEQYSHEEGCSVTGGYVYRGDKWPALIDTYFFGDYCSGSIWALPAGDPAAGAIKILTTENRISSFGLTRSGEILMVDHGGRVLKIEST
jgi:glucose/arabinose dehydrogenase